MLRRTEFSRKTSSHIIPRAAIGLDHHGQQSDIASLRQIYVVFRGYAACQWQKKATNNSFLQYIAVTNGTAPDTSPPLLQRHPPSLDVALCLDM